MNCALRMSLSDRKVTKFPRDGNGFDQPLVPQKRHRFAHRGAAGPEPRAGLRLGYRVPGGSDMERMADFSAAWICCAVG
jgi:hypothetical protein